MCEAAFLPGVKNPAKICICANFVKMFQDLMVGPKKVSNTSLTFLEQETKIVFEEPPDSILVTEQQFT